MKRWMIAAVAAAMAAAVASWLVFSGRPATPVAARPATTAPAATRVVASDPEAGHIGDRMTRQAAFADEIMFLIVAALRNRCMPAYRHDLPRMAVLARLPLLTSEAEGSAEATSLRRGIGRIVDDVALRASCARPVSLRIGAYALIVDPDAYAAAFPDSYFDPTLATPPSEFDGAPLHLRVADRCLPLAYAVLALDDVHPWQCAGLRADTRSSILKLCRAEGEFPDQAATDIRKLVSRLPANCQ